MEKKGQESVGISFSMIFSIIIIIGILGVAIYAITSFLDIRNCANTGFFYQDIQDEIDRGWSSSSYSKIYDAEVPKGTEWVCFGNQTDIASNSISMDAKLKDKLTHANEPKSHTVYLFPLNNACDGLTSKKLEHMKVANFFCTEVKDKKISFLLKKEIRDTLVTIKTN